MKRLFLSFFLISSTLTACEKINDLRQIRTTLKCTYYEVCHETLSVDRINEIDQYLTDIYDTLRASCDRCQLVFSKRFDCYVGLIDTYLFEKDLLKIQ